MLLGFVAVLTEALESPHPRTKHFVENAARFS